MTCDKRILYLDYYEDEVRLANAGFVKLVRWTKSEETDRGRICMQLYISRFPVKELVEGVIKLVQGEKEICLSRIKVADGKGMIQIEDLEAILESADMADEQKKILLRIEFAEAGVLESVLRQGMPVHLPALSQSRMDAAEDTDEEKEVLVYDKEKILMESEEVKAAEDTDMQESKEFKVPQIPQRMNKMQHDKWQQLATIFPHIRPFDDEREYLQAELKDMVVLSDMYYRLVENSFLLHGYFNYGHLILTKIYKKGSEKIYLGVPGNYYDKEAQVAVMFGFESFEPKTEPAGEGAFGYYMIGVGI